MQDVDPAVLDFLLTRRSRPAKTLAAPYPDRATLATLLRAAARTPDHGKLEPWRFIVLSGPALPQLAGMVRRIGAAQARPEADIAKMADQFDRSGCAVAVVASPKPSDKIPAIEQAYSAGAVCLALLNAALASGWGANWLSGWAAHDREFRETALGLAPQERIAGFVHIGSATAAPPERPRPDLDAIVTWRGL